MQFIDLKTQYRRIEKEVQEGIQAVLSHGQYILGPEVKTLEENLANFVDSQHAIAVSSGTDALLLALMALDIKPGDEVITTPFSFFATAEVILLLGAKPVFVDICPDTYNIDVAKIEAAITHKTKCIMPVSLYGQCADMDGINKIAKANQLSVIEDAAQSFGAEYKGRASCGLSDIACTSFFPSKPLGGYGDSGACFTNNKALADKIRAHSVHGQTARYQHPYLGINGRMDTMQAAVLIEKLKIFKDEVALRQEVAKRYFSLLEGMVKLPLIAADNKSVFAQFTIEVDDRQSLVDALSAANIPTAIHYPIPLHLQPAMASLNYKLGDFPVAENVSNRVLSLPMSPYLDEASQTLIAQEIKTHLG